MKQLSKSNYVRGWQCPKILWMDQNKKEEAQDVLNYTVLNNGTKVGELAREYFGDDFSQVKISPRKDRMIKETKEFLDQGKKVIAEASFLHDGLYCAVDLLKMNDDGTYDIVEVKSSTHVSLIYVEDMAFQYFVVKHSGIPVSHVYCMHINSKYERHGALDLQELFTLEDYTEEVMKREKDLPYIIKSILSIAERGDEPEMMMSTWCEQPYECAYRHYCMRKVPSDGKTVFDVARIKTDTKYSLFNKGVITFDDLIRTGEVNTLSANQKKQVRSAVLGLEPEIYKEKIRKFLKELTYPVYHLDFETYQKPIPEYDGMHPFEQIPFQYSLHVEGESGTILAHGEYLAQPGTDPRRGIAEALCRDIPETACVLAYNMSFEKGRIKALAQIFPDLHDHLMAIHDNIRDLMIPFQKGWYYDKAFQGSYSIKYVLPGLYPDDPDLDYHNLEGVHNGQEASDAFLSMEKKDQVERDRIRGNLLKYCGLDTFAMVKVLSALKEAAKD